MLRKVTANKRWLVGLAILAMLGIGIPVMAGADTDQFKSNGGSANASSYVYGANNYDYEYRNVSAYESGSGADRTTRVTLHWQKRVYNSTRTGWAYAYKRASGLMTNPKDFTVSGNTARLEVNGEDLPDHYAYGYQYGTNPPPIPTIGDFGDVTIDWKSNGIYSYMNTGHNVRSNTDPSTGATYRRVSNGKSSQDSADATGTFGGADFVAQGYIAQNKNLTVQITKD